MLTRLDHVVVTVDSLRAAARDFAAAGFTVTPGGRHDALPTENALVVFADGSYLELLACVDPAVRAGLRALRAGEGWDAHLRGASAIGRRFLPRLAGPDGVGDAVVLASRLERVADESRRREFVMTGPVAMSRAVEGAEPLAWDLLLPAEDALPFFIEDRTPRARRVPGDAAATRHANGARGIAVVQVGTADVPAAALRIADLFEAKLESRMGRSVATFAGTEWHLAPAVREGANGVRIAGPAALPPALEALGVRAAFRKPGEHA